MYCIVTWFLFLKNWENKICYWECTQLVLCQFWAIFVNTKLWGSSLKYCTSKTLTTPYLCPKKFTIHSYCEQVWIVKFYLVISQFKVAQSNCDGAKLLWTKVWASNPFWCTIFQRAPSEFCVYKNGSNLAQSLLSTVYTTYLHLPIFSKKGLMLLCRRE